MEKSKPLVANIFTNPIGWAGTVVGTTPRYVFSLILVPVAVFLFLSSVVEVNVMDHWDAALMMMALPFMFIYSMRKLYQRVEELNGLKE